MSPHLEDSRRAAGWALSPVTVLAVAVLAAAAGCGGDQWRALDTQLNAAAEPARREGFAPLAGPHNDFGTFADSLLKPWRVTLDSAATYVVGAACLGGCAALDLAVRGPDAALVTADTTTGPEPWLRFTAPRSGSFTVRVTGRCAPGNTCWWIAQIYGRGQGLRPGFAGGER